MLQARHEYLDLKKHLRKLKKHAFMSKLSETHEMRSKKKVKEYLYHVLATYRHPLLNQILPHAMGFLGNLKKIEFLTEKQW